MDRGAWWATVHRVPESQTRLRQLSTQDERRPKALSTSHLCQRSLSSKSLRTEASVLAHRSRGAKSGAPARGSQPPQVRVLLFPVWGNCSVLPSPLPPWGRAGTVSDPQLQRILLHTDPLSTQAACWKQALGPWVISPAKETPWLWEAKQRTIGTGCWKC